MPAIHVEGIPPYKQPSASEREKELQETRLKMLQDEARKVINQPFKGDVSLKVRYVRSAGKADALNILGGIGDALQGIAYEDDRQIRRVEYVEERGERDEYWVEVEPL